MFTEYRDTLRRVADYLRDLAPVELHGGLTPSERQAVLRRFVAGDARLLLATDAASEGLNLHHRCRLVINLELPWTPVRLEQRIGRVERLGQTKRVHAVHLLAAGTAEEESVAVFQARMRHVAGVLGDMRAESPPTCPAGLKSKTRPTLRCLPASWLAMCARSRGMRQRASNTPGSVPADSRHAPVDGRPCITVWPRATRFGNYWAYRLHLEDPDGQPIWETLIGIREALSMAPRGSRDLRLRLDSLDGLIEPMLTSASKALRSSLLSSRHAEVSLSIQRESAIVGELERQRGRLAGSLVQPGLFDRRTERAAAARNATLDEAVARCTRRLAELTSQSQISFDRPRLAFGRDPTMIPGVRGGLISASFARDVLPSMPGIVPLAPAIGAKLASWSRRLEATLGTGLECPRHHRRRGPAAAQICSACQSNSASIATTPPCFM